MQTSFFPKSAFYTVAGTSRRVSKDRKLCSEKFGLDPLTRRCAPPSPPRGRGQGYFSCFAGVAKRHDKLHCKAIISCFFGKHFADHVGPTLASALAGASPGPTRPVGLRP
jgi:hypothetical protein